MTAIVRCYDRLGNFLDVLDNAQLGTRSWVTNRIGDFDFRLPRTDPKATRENLGKLNMIRVESDTGIPDWGGRIKDLSWEDAAYVYVRCESKEGLLRRHVIEDYSRTTRQTTGQIIQAILQQELAASGGIPGISIGKIENSGETTEYTAHGLDLWDDVIQDMLQFLDDVRKRAFVWVDADGKFYWQMTRGKDLSAMVVLRSGYHLQKWPRYRIDYSKILTQAIGYSNQSDWKLKHKMRQRNLPAWNDWGTLEGTITAKRGESAATAEKFARMLVRANYAPTEMLDIQINNRDGIWSQFWIGDTVRVVIPNFGWQESGGCDVKLNITGIEVQEKPQVMRIIGSVVQPAAEESWGVW